MCMLKSPTVVNMITCRLSSCKTGVYNLRLLIILERGLTVCKERKQNDVYIIFKPSR